MKRTMKKLIKKMPIIGGFITSLYNWMFAPFRIQQEMELLNDSLRLNHYLVQRSIDINPINRFAAKCFSQSDEDGIVIEILRRIDLIRSPGVFMEFGVGTGDENNTLSLLNLGWSGVWVGNEALKVNHKSNKNFSYQKKWVTVQNINEIATEGLRAINQVEYDLISMDLDGNDYYFVDALLENNFLPKIFIVEYNGKFPPPMKFKMPYDEKNMYHENDYYGASLQTYSDLFEKYDYMLVCCNLMTGVNAFFVKNKYATYFNDVPKNINDLYVIPNYQLLKKYGHKKSIMTIEAACFQ